MEDLFSFVVVAVAIIGSLVSGIAKNASKKQKRDGVPPMTARPVTTRPVTQPKRVEKPAAKPVTVSTSAPVGPAQAAPREEPAVMLPPQEDREGRRPGDVAKPLVHPHLAPDCDEHEDEGSLHYQSTEGVDPCHDDELPDRLTPRPAYQPPMQEQPGLTLEWTGDALVKSVVMQEILTRPSQRRRIR